MKPKNRHPLSPEELMAYLDGQLGQEQRTAVEEHLKSCPQCRSLMESLSLAEAEVAKAEQVQAPEGYFSTFASRVANRISKVEAMPRPRPWLLRWVWLPAAATATMAIVIILWHESYRTPPAYQTATREGLIPIPIAPEPRPPEEYYEELVITTHQASDTSVKMIETTAPKAEMANLHSQPAPQFSATESPGETDRQFESKKARSRMAKTAQQPNTPQPATAGVLQETPASKDAAAPVIVAGSSEMDKTPEARSIIVKRIVRHQPRIRERFYQPGEDLLYPSCEVTCLQAVVIHLPNGGQAPPPQVEPALRICIPQ